MQLAPIPTVSVLEHCRLAPPSGDAAAQLSLPLTFFDTVWLNFYLTQRLLFYVFPRPKSHFIETIVPKLKESLSLTLKHFLPLAGNLIYPNPNSDSGKPELRYTIGDSVPVTFAESCDDFNNLVGDHARNADNFYSLIPDFPLPSESPSSGLLQIELPLFAVQVTVFPDFGMSIGCTGQHVIGDASVVVGFTRAWASINKSSGDAQLPDVDLLPFYDRSVIQDPYQINSIFLNEMKKINFWESARVAKLPTQKVRSTYVLSRADIQKLKSFVFAKMPSPVHVSNFTVTCAYVWTCWVKSGNAVGEEKVDENEAEYFICSADCRARLDLDPPIPATYFGNCLVSCLAKARHGELVGSGGLLIAAELLGEAIHERVHDKEAILKGTWFFELESINWQRKLGVSGSPKYDTYDADFGWGKPEKYECISIDNDGFMSLNKSRKHEGGLEVGLSLPKNRMDLFAAVFTDGLRIL